MNDWQFRAMLCRDQWIFRVLHCPTPGPAQCNSGAHGQLPCTLRRATPALELPRVTSRFAGTTGVRRQRWSHGAVPAETRHCWTMRSISTTRNVDRNKCSGDRRRAM
jgi:hypothetical protein